MVIVGALAPFTQSLTFAVATLAMVGIGMTRKRLEWRQPRPSSERRRRHWPWQKTA